MPADALASEPTAPGPRIGDCVIFREGGVGYILTMPVYWLQGTVAGLVRQRRLAARCPDIGKPLAAYTPADWRRLADAMPCVERDAEVAEREVWRVQMKVDSWETPWSSAHGTAGWLFRGQFLDRTLAKGQLIDMDATWLAPCEARP